MSIMIQTRRSPEICIRAARPVIAAVNGSVADRAATAEENDSARPPAAPVVLVHGRRSRSSPGRGAGGR